MSLEISPELAAIIRQKVDDGRYPSEDAVVEAAMELLERRDVSLQELRTSIDVAVEQLDRGEGITYANVDEFKAAIKARAARIAESRPTAD